MMLDILPNSCDVMKQNNNELIINNKIIRQALYETNINYYMNTNALSTYTNIHR